MAELTFAQQGRRDGLIAIVRTGQRAFVDVGNALRQIRDEKLWRGVDATFESFCGREFGFKKSRAYQLIDAAKVVDDQSKHSDADNGVFSDCGGKNRSGASKPSTPKNERQARAAKASTKPTAVEVRRAVEEVTDTTPSVPAEPWANVNAAIDDAVGLLKSANSTMRQGFGIEGQEVTGKYAKRFSYLGTIGAVNQVVRDLENGRVVGADAKGIVTAVDEKKREALRQGAA